MQDFPGTRPATATPEHCPFVLGADESARLRFPWVESHAIGGAQPGEGFSVTVALPLSFAKNRRRRYPLLLLADGRQLLGSAIEMLRVLAMTREAGECILVCHDDAWLATADAAAQAARIGRIVDWCRARFRVRAGEVAFFAQGRSLACARQLRGQQPAVIDRWIVADHEAAACEWATAVARSGRPSLAWTTIGKPVPAAAHSRLLPESTTEGASIPALTHGILSFWGTGRAYGSELKLLGQPLVTRALGSLRPLIRWLRRGAEARVGDGEGAASRHVLHSRIMDRDFEIFVSLPQRMCRAGGYPAVVALDANSTWSCVSEIAARMAQAGEIQDLITVGVGVPRAEGDIAFGLRRFAELSPPAGDAAFQGELGRFFLSIFSLYGCDARQHFGLAPQFHRFLSEELLPLLLRTLPIDPARLCLVGHSAAGTYAAYELAQPDSPFSQVAALSPGVAISDQWMLRQDGGLAAGAGGKDLLVTIGGEERDNAFNRLAGIPLSEHYADALRRQGQGGKVDYACLEGETHSTVFPRAYALLLARRFPMHDEGENRCSN